MAKIVKLEMTIKQIEALINITDTISAMIGTGSDFDKMQNEVNKIDEMFHSNGYTRKYK